MRNIKDKRVYCTTDENGVPSIIATGKVFKLLMNGPKLESKKLVVEEDVPRFNWNPLTEEFEKQ